MELIEHDTKLPNSFSLQPTAYRMPELFETASLRPDDSCQVRRHTLAKALMVFATASLHDTALDMGDGI